MNEAKRRRDLLDKATTQPTGEKAPSAAAERDAKRRRALQAETKPDGEGAPRAAVERDAKRRRALQDKTKPNG